MKDHTGDGGFATSEVDVSLPFAIYIIFVPSLAHQEQSRLVVTESAVHGED